MEIDKINLMHSEFYKMEIYQNGIKFKSKNEDLNLKFTYTDIVKIGDIENVDSKLVIDYFEIIKKNEIKQFVTINDNKLIIYDVDELIFYMFTNIVKVSDAKELENCIIFDYFERNNLIDRDLKEELYSLYFLKPLSFYSIDYGYILTIKDYNEFSREIIIEETRSQITYEDNFIKIIQRLDYMPNVREKQIKDMGKLLNLFPLGTVVQLKDYSKENKLSEFSYIITDRFILKNKDSKEYYEYKANIYPLGNLFKDKEIVFNDNDIGKVEFIGYETEADSNLVEDVKKKLEEKNIRKIKIDSH